MDSMTNLSILLKNLKRFINNVPIDPNSPDKKAWGKDRAEMKRALNETERNLKKLGILGGLNVFVGPRGGCKVVLSKQTRELAKPFKQYARDVQKIVEKKHKLISPLKPVSKKG